MPNCIKYKGDSCIRVFHDADMRHNFLPITVKSDK